MSFRKRNVVLSAAPSSEPAAKSAETGGQPETKTGRTPPATPQPRRIVPSLTLQSARSISVRPAQTPTPIPAPPLAPETAVRTRHPALPPPHWTVASRPEISPARRSSLEPAKLRLRALLDQDRQKRQKRHEPAAAGAAQLLPQLGPGARPSPFDGRPITSTGTASLDGMLAGYGGLALGHSLLIEELGTTDFASVLLRAYAAEGLVQGHYVHVMGFGHGWKSELPGISQPMTSKTGQRQSSAMSDIADKMKIAWRYETLSARPGLTGGPRGSLQTSLAASPASPSPAGSYPAVFCHSLDPSRRLSSADNRGTLCPFLLPNPLLPSLEPEPVHSPLTKFLFSVRASLDATPPATIHRVVIPNFLAPTLYAMDGWSFPYVTSLLLGLRNMLREYGRRLTVMVSLSTSLYGRHIYSVHQMEKLFDNVAELIPLPPGPPSVLASKGSSKHRYEKTPAQKMQGWFKVHKLQVYSEIGGAGASPQGKFLRDNFCFSLSASRGMEISPFSLPPIEDESPSVTPHGTATKQDIEF